MRRTPKEYARMSEDVKAGRYVAHAAVPVLYVMRGLPGSGKSTRAKELSEYLGGVEVVNRDELRMALIGSYWTGDPDDEAKVSFYERSLVNDNLSKGRSVIVDSTHISFASVRAWEPYANEHGARIEVIDVDTAQVLGQYEPSSAMRSRAGVGTVRQRARRTNRGHRRGYQRGHLRDAQQGS